MSSRAHNQRKYNIHSSQLSLGTPPVKPRSAPVLASLAAPSSIPMSPALPRSPSSCPNSISIGLSTTSNAVVSMPELLAMIVGWGSALGGILSTPAWPSVTVPVGAASSPPEGTIGGTWGLDGGDPSVPDASAEVGGAGVVPSPESGQVRLDPEGRVSSVPP